MVKVLKRLLHPPLLQTATTKRGPPEVALTDWFWNWRDALATLRSSALNGFARAESLCYDLSTSTKFQLIALVVVVLSVSRRIVGMISECLSDSPWRFRIDEVV